MDAKALVELDENELITLARNRGIEMRRGESARKEALRTKLLQYHRKYKYTKLNFKKDRRKWMRDQLIVEAKATGFMNIKSQKKQELIDIILQRNDSSTNDKMRNKKIKKTKLKRKQETVMQNLKELEKHIVSVYIDLKKNFKYVNKPKISDEFPEQESLKTIGDTADDIDAWTEKILEIFPLIMEAKELVHCFSEYRNSLNKFYDTNSKQTVSKNQKYYIAMRKYKKKSDYENDEIGPICGIFDNNELFNKFKNDKETHKKYGKKIKKIRYTKENQPQYTKQQKKSTNEMDLESSADENDENVEFVEDDEISELEEEDEDEETHQEQDHEDKEEDEETEDDDDVENAEDDDEDDGNDDTKMKNGKKEKKNSRSTKNTRSRRMNRKRVSGQKRKNVDQDVSGNDRKRAKLNKSSLPPQIVG